VTRTPTGPLSGAIAEQLRAAFHESGRRQSDVGEAAGVSQSQLSKILRGVRVPDVDTLDAICAALQLDVVEVVAAAARKIRG